MIKRDTDEKDRRETAVWLSKEFSNPSAGESEFIFIPNCAPRYFKIKSARACTAISAILATEGQWVTEGQTSILVAKSKLIFKGYVSLKSFQTSKVVFLSSFFIVFFKCSQKIAVYCLF